MLQVDAGGGSMNGVNWLLRRGYRVHCKDFSRRRAAHVASGVGEWHDGPRQRGRRPGWALVKGGDYERRVRRLGLRWQKRSGRRRKALLKKYGVRRLVRDMLQVSGYLECEGENVIKRVASNEASALLAVTAFSRRGGLWYQCGKAKVSPGLMIVGVRHSRRVFTRVSTHKRVEK